MEALYYMRFFRCGLEFETDICVGSLKYPA